MNQLDKVKDVLEGMVGIGGIPNNEEFYEEFNLRVKGVLGIKLECEWKYMNIGMYGCNDYIYKTSCGREYDVNKINKPNFCPHCGNNVS